jgi:acyl-CoA thioesterase
VGTFANDTAVTRAADGALTCVLDDEWWVFNGPNGGYLAAIAVHALEAGLEAADRPLRSLTMHYMRVPAAGPATIEVVPEREGRSVTFARLRMVQDGRPFATAVAVLAKSREAMTLDTGRAPDVPPPDEIAVIDPGGQPPTFARHFDYRSASEPPVAEEAVTGGWLRLRDHDQPLDAAFVAALTDSWIPALFTKMAEPMALPTLDLTVHLRARLPQPAAWVLGRYTTRTVADGLLEEDAELFTADGALLAHSRQLAVAV